ncbi:MAG: D-2-hydroxyacid dehydrogenase [Planctomycetes bacterium]|nr:D-2-hydroxyacid dehydrogenase [Planctomycetota bacterium]
MRLIIHPPVEPARLEKIIAAAGDMTVVNADDEAAALAAMSEADAFFGKLSPPLLAASKKLRWVQSPTASLEHYVFPELVEHPCTLTNMRGLFNDNIADQVFGYILCFARNLHLYVRNQLQARWAPVGGEDERVNFTTGPAYVTGIDAAHQNLADQTIGIVGLGGIGGEIARRAAAWGIRVIAVDAARTDKPDGVAELWSTDRLDDLLAESDYVVVAAPHTPDTEQLFVREKFAKMKPTAYFINIGRGAIVSLSDLHAALESGQIAGAALDVYEIEPLPSDHPLWQLPNVILTPHVAGYSPRIAERHLAVLLDNIRRFVRGETLVNIADKRRWF